MRILLVILLSVLLAALAWHALFTYDVWTHLAAGRYIVENGHVPHQDPFSSTLAGKPWVDHEWLFQLGLYPLYRAGGVTALNVLRTGLVLATFVVLLLTVTRRENHLLALVVVLAAAMTSYTRFQMRPELLSFLFLAVMLAILKRTAGRPDSRWLWVLPVIQLVWVNVHGLFILGPLVVLIFILGQGLSRLSSRALAWTVAGVMCVAAQIVFTDWLIESVVVYAIPFVAAIVISLVLAHRGQSPRTRSESVSHLKRWALILGLMIVACFVNPYFHKGALYPIEVAQQLAARSEGIQLIGELVPTLSLVNVTQTGWFKLLALLVLVSFVLNFKRTSFARVLLVGLSWPFALMAARNTPIFAVIGALCASLNFSQWWQASREDIVKRFESLHQLQVVRTALQLALAVVLVWLILDVTSDRMHVRDRTGLHFGGGTSPVRFSEDAMTFVRDNELQEPLFNNLAAGGMCMFHLHPDYSVYIDGRVELYGSDALLSYETVMRRPDSFRELARQKGFNTVFLTKGSYDGLDLAKALYKDPGWKLVFMDGASWVFVRDIPEHRAVIDSVAGAFDFANEDLRARKTLNEVQPDEAATGEVSGGFESALIDIEWFRQMDYLDLAESRIRRLCERFPEVPDVHFTSAVVYQSRGYYLRMKEVPKRIGSRLDAAIERMNAYYGKTEEAYDRVARLQPDFPGLYSSVATFYANTDRPEPARRALERALAVEYHSKRFLKNVAAFAQDRLGDIFWAERLRREADRRKR